MIATPSARRGRSSNVPPLSTRNFARSFVSYSSGLATGPPPYTESRASVGLRLFRVVSGGVGTPRVEVRSNVKSWSMNWPKNVVPAV